MSQKSTIFELFRRIKFSCTSLQYGVLIVPPKLLKLLEEFLHKITAVLDQLMQQFVGSLSALSIRANVLLLPTKLNK